MKKRMMSILLLATMVTGLIAGCGSTKKEAKNDDDDVLDVGCGNGQEGRALVEKGYNVVGVDLEPDMVEVAISHGIDAEVLDMLKINEIRGDYDMIYTVGNTLAHLDDMGEVINFLEKAYRKLKTDGALVLQIINFSLYWKDDAKDGEHLGSLPKITGDDLEFTRDYYKKGEKILFKTEVKYKDKDFNNEVLLYPIDKNKLRENLEEIGFKDIEVYGGFNKSEVGDGRAIVIRARKRKSDNN